MPMNFDSQSHEPGDPIPESGNWLVDIIRYCLANNLCTKINCTTCGATEYRQIYLATAAAKLGLNPGNRPKLGNWILRDRKKVLQLLAEELKNIRTEDIQELDFSGIDLLIQDLYYICPKNELDLPTLLGDSPAGEILERMIAHHNRRIAEAQRNAEYELQNRKDKEIARQEHQQRMFKSIPGPSVPDSPKDTWVKSIQQKLSGMTPDQRLSLIAEEEPEFPLAAVPRNCIPIDADVSRLSNDKRHELRDRIGDRKHGWQRIASQLSDD